MGSFNEDFKHLMDDFFKAGLGNSSLPTSAKGEDYNLETVTEIILTRINSQIGYTSDAKKKKSLQDLAAKAVSPYLKAGNDTLSPDMKQKLSSIYGMDNLVFVPQDKAYQDALNTPKSTWDNDFGCLKDKFTRLVPSTFPVSKDVDYDLEQNCTMLLARLADAKQGMRDKDKIDQINALAVKAAELYLQKSGTTAVELPDTMKKNMVDILGEHTKIISDTPDKTMNFNLSACLNNKYATPQKTEKTEKKPSLWSRFKNKAKEIWNKPAVRATRYAAVGVVCGAATAGLIIATGGVAGGAYAAASLGNAAFLAMCITTAGSLASLYAAGYQMKKAIAERRAERLKKADFATKREKVILDFKANVEQLQKEGNIVSAVFEITKLDEQLKPLTAQEHKEMGTKNKQNTGLRTEEFSWVKNFYPPEFTSSLSSTLKLARIGHSETEIRGKVAPSIEKAKTEYSQRLEKEKNQPKSTRFSSQKRDMHRLSHEYRRNASRIG